MKVYTYSYLELNGRLGNQLHQIAATINAAESDGDAIARFRPDWEYRPFFSVPDEYFEPFDETKFQVLDGGTNYFQDMCHMAPIEPLLRDIFAPSVMALEETLMARLAMPLDGLAIPLCAVHVRRGDYLKYPGHFPISTAKYYTEAINTVREESGPDTAFLVFSNDLPWCKAHPEHFGWRSDDRVVFVEGVERPVEIHERKGAPQDWIDLFLQTLCSSHIISNSTFSWWGAFLSNDKHPIYPSKWFGPAVPGWENWENVIPDGWRKFEC